MRDQKLLADAASADRPWRKAVVLSLAAWAALTFAGCSRGVKPPNLAPASSPLPCAEFPTKPAATLEETAWQIFVAATCPNPVPVFETWVEQNNLNLPPGEAAGKRHLHRSVLQAALAGGLPSNDCGPMMTVPSAQQQAPSLVPFVPTNLANGAKFCEEVFANPAEVAYIREPVPGNSSYSLLTLPGQAAYVKDVKPIEFPTKAIEIKADWLPASSLNPAAFDCKQASPDLHTETINGTCYALVGLHISSKLYPNWLWATFEPQFSASNPNRCKPSLYSSCNDPWGSSPAKSTGEKTGVTPALAKLMDEAGFPRASAFRNYRLVGVQTGFVHKDTAPILLGNSFTEFNAGVGAQQASCITCHSYARFDSSKTPPQENPNFGPFPGEPPVGPSHPAKAPWQSQDFSWMLGIL